MRTPRQSSRHSHPPGAAGFSLRTASRAGRSSRFRPRAGRRALARARYCRAGHRRSTHSRDDWSATRASPERLDVYCAKRRLGMPRLSYRGAAHTSVNWRRHARTPNTQTECRVMGLHPCPRKWPSPGPKPFRGCIAGRSNRAFGLQQVAVCVCRPQIGVLSVSMGCAPDFKKILTRSPFMTAGGQSSLQSQECNRLKKERNSDAAPPVMIMTLKATQPNVSMLQGRIELCRDARRAPNAGLPTAVGAACGGLPTQGRSLPEQEGENFRGFRRTESPDSFDRTGKEGREIACPFFRGNFKHRSRFI